MVPLSGKHTWPDGVVYEGTFDDNGNRHGAGCTTLPNGLVHKGQVSVHGHTRDAQLLPPRALARSCWPTDSYATDSHPPTHN